jgi:transposase
MSYRELTMIEIREVVRRWQAAQSLRQITRDTALDRKTVRRYIRTAKACGLARGGALEDAAIERVVKRVQGRPTVARTEEWRAVEAQRAQIEGWLGGERPLKLRKIHVLLVRKGVQASYSTLRRFAQRELGWRKRPPTVRLAEPPPGQEAQLDFGKMGMAVDGETGKRRALWALIVTLSYSRYMFVWPSFLQTTAAVCEGLERAWAFFGAMARTLLPDNCKAMVSTPDAHEPKLVAAFAEYVQARGIFVDPARVRRPKDKARVENQVPYVRESWFEGEDFQELSEMRRSAEVWCRETAGGRIHGTTRRVPREMYEGEERPAMQPPPSTPFDVPIWVEEATVHPDHHVQVAHALYSVPTRHVGKIVRVRVDKTTVRIFLGAEMIKMHGRVGPGQRSTDVNDYPPGKAAYALRSVEALVKKAKEKGPNIGAYAERIVAGPLPWSRMRAGYALMRLCDKYGVERVESVCKSALAFDVVDVHRVTKMLKTAVKPAVAAQLPGERRRVVQLPLPRFARGEEHFETRQAAGRKEGV